MVAGSTPRRRRICGFSVARDCFGGLALLLAIPAAAAVHLAVVVLTPCFAASQSSGALLAEVAAELLLCGAAVVALFLLLVADPGFVGEPTDLSCRCSRCGVDVDDFDHHCGVVGACIGKRNMCYFILFLLAVTLLCVLVTVQNVSVAVLAVHAHIGDSGPFWTSRAAFLSAVLDTTRLPTLICFAVLSAAAIAGGVLCAMLCLRYTYLAYCGRSSVLRRRRTDCSSTLGAVFAHTMHPSFSHNYQHLRHYSSVSISD
ncbi:DHHC palmitoyltransferase [Novymonas esmeraldas]|uniref:Palmitoyltransferase n=1 Tax=Novymonas esmeraldas TaxID=1808958 RepID=A0AAW0ETP5_9TRYP